MSETRCVQVQDGVVVNAIIADPDTFKLDGCLIIASDTAQPGDNYADGKFTTPKS